MADKKFTLHISSSIIESSIMNSSYRSLWNDRTGTFVAVSENTTSQGKKTSGVCTASGAGARCALQALALSMACVFAANAQSLPVGGVVAAGSASISSTNSKTTINQASQSAIINWQSFNIGTGQSVQFVQPNVNSVALNRVLGADPSSIFGNLSANGKVFLVNPNGILFGQGAAVNVGGLVASTRNITDSNFLAGNYQFSGTGSGTVVNQGSINADGGYVALLGASVSNQGVISAQLGTVALAAGNALTLDVAGDGLLNIAVNQGAVNALVHNGGLIQADGGNVLLTAQGAGSLLQSAVNNTGVIQAQTLVNGKDGTIKLMGDMQSGTVNVGGTLDVSGQGSGQAGGNVMVTGHHVGLFGANINASGDAGGGTVLIGGDYQGKNPNIQNAAATYMSADSNINADAITQGSGGKVIVWSDDSTRAYGSISARGGVQGGDGGLIETSGHWLDVAGIEINANALNGKSGTWLLDPADIIISGAATTGATLTGSVFAPDDGVGSAVINAGALQGTLNAGTDVTITTTNNGAAGGGIGDITVASALTWTTAKSLTLNAAHDVVINAAIVATTVPATLTGSAIVLTAGHNVLINAAMTASSNNSAIRLTAGNDIIAGFAITASAADTAINMSAGNNVDVTTVTASGGGAMNLRANNNVIVRGVLTADTATAPVISPVTLIADNDGTGPGVAAGTVIFTGGVDKQSVTPNTKIRFNPDGYVNTTAEIAAYQAKVSAILDAKAWVFGLGNNKMYDGTTAATVSGLKPDASSVVPSPGLGAVSNANFDTKDVGTAKLITFDTTYVDPVYAFFAPVGTTAGTYTTRADITVRPLGVTASNLADKIYGTTASFALPGFTSTGLQNSETIGSVSLVSAGLPATAPVASYAIVPSAATGGTFTPSNYNITYVNGILAVVPASLVITANNATKPYGQALTLPATAFTTAGLVNGDTVTSVLETSPGTVATALVADNPHVITVSGATGTNIAGNYTISYVNGALTVTPIPMTVTANNASKPYGQTATLPATAFTTAGLVNGDTVTSVIETSPGTVATASVAGNPYTITPSGATGTYVSGNYTISYVNGALTVTPIPMTVTANNASKPYGQALTLPTTAFTTAGLVNGDTVTSVIETSPGTVATASVAGAPYVITASGATGSYVPTNYTVGYVNGALAVTPAPLTVTANDASKPYGQVVNLPATAFTSTGLVNGDTVTSVTETSPGTVATAPVAGTPYAITASGAAGSFTPGNYTIAYVNGALTVTPIPMTVTANNASKVYGQTATLPTTAFTTAGLVNGDTVTSVLETSPGTVATASVAGAPYVITASGATGSYVPTNYTVGYVNAALAVTPAPLTITANDASKVYGQVVTFPATAFTSTGLVNGDTVSSVLETSPGTVAKAPVGSLYAITPSGATGSYEPTNYTLAYVDGKLTVLAVPVAPPIAPPVIEVPPDRVPPIVVVPPVLTPAYLIPPAIVPPEVVVPAAEVAPPVVVPVETQPSSYVAPVHKRKQDRN
jgi:filamentous hemagglutinin family protein